jgi:putative membrane protein
MIVEDPNRWLKPVFEFHKADTFRKLLPMLVMLGIFTGAVAWVEMNYLHLRDSHPLKNITLMHSLLGFAISMLLVFRTNTAYDRWWEGRKLWGSLVNASRNLGVKLHAYLPPDQVETRTWFAKLIGLYAVELKNHLMREQTRLQLDERPHPELPDLDRAKHIPTQVVSRMVEKLTALGREGHLSENQQLLLNNEITALLDICGACERIKNTPIPFSYIVFIKKFIVAYTLTLPLGYVFSLSWLAIPVVTFIFYVLASLELIAEQIEEPFGNDANDLPMERLSVMISNNLREILG